MTMTPRRETETSAQFPLKIRKFARKLGVYLDPTNLYIFGLSMLRWSFWYREEWHKGNVLVSLWQLVLAQVSAFGPQQL